MPAFLTVWWAKIGVAPAARQASLILLSTAPMSKTFDALALVLPLSKLVYAGSKMMTLQIPLFDEGGHGSNIAIVTELGRCELEVDRGFPGLRFFDAKILRTVVATVGALLSPLYMPTATCFSTRKR